MQRTLDDVVGPLLANFIIMIPLILISSYLMANAFASAWEVLSANRTPRPRPRANSLRAR